MVRAALASWMMVGLLACAGDDTDETPTGETGDEGPGTIVDIASADPNFSTLVDLLGQADGDLVDLLSGDGPFTVFAPTNAAFSGVDTSGLSPADLQEILTYHVVSGEVPSTAIPALADSAAGFTLFFDTTSGVVVNDATVDMADIEASNGIIHVIDGVLLPPDIIGAAGFAGLDSLAGAIGGAEADVATTLQGEGPFTVFAPDNDAFTAAADVIATLDQAGVSDVLRYHVYPGAVDSANIPAAANSALRNDSDTANVTALFSTEGGAFINGVDIVLTDVRTTNGIVHIIDEVLLPPTILDLAGIAGLTELAGAIGMADAAVGTTLAGDGPFTVFAPTNDAFTSIAATVAGLDQGQLTNVLLFHVVDTATFPDTPVFFGDLSDSEVPTLLPGQTITIDVDEMAMTATAEGANIAIPDVNGTNGTVHVIDAVMIPEAF